MGKSRRGKRDGTGPYKNSRRRKVEGRKTGRRGGICRRRKK